MYTVRCYYANGELVDEGDMFDHPDDAYEFAKEMTEHFLVDIVKPDGTIICVN